MKILKNTNEKWPYIPDHLCRILIIGGSGSGKTNTLLNLISEQNDIDKIYLYVRDLNEPKYKILIKKREDAGIKHLNDPNAFIECSNTMDDVYENINDYNSSRKRKILIVFYMIADIMTNKKFQAIIRELQSIAINHSADIDYQDFIKIYRECTKEPYNFLTIDTRLPASDPLRFRKKLFDSYKNDNN